MFCSRQVGCGHPVFDPGRSADDFYAAPSALTGNDTIPDRRGYNFDGCSPGQLYQASVKDGQVVFSWWCHL